MARPTVSTTTRYNSIAQALIENNFTSIKTDDKHSYKRLINRCVTEGYWFVAWQQQGTFYIGFSLAVNFERDLTAKLPNIKFELD